MITDPRANADKRVTKAAEARSETAAPVAAARRA
jgi:hypothetical protein